MYKKTLILGLFVAALIVPLVALGATFRAGEELNLGQNVPIGEDLYAVGGNVTATSQVTGDLAVAGGNLILSGSTTEDLLVGGGMINISGGVGEDLRAVGGNLTLDGNVGDDAVMAGGQINVLPDSNVGGDLAVAAGQVVMGGVVRGNANLNGGQVTINGTVNGNVEVRADKVTIGEGAVINGRLTYFSPNEAQVGSGARIAGGVDYRPIEDRRREAAAIAGGISAGWLFFKLLTLFVLGWLLYRLSGTAAGRLVVEATERFWAKLGIGFLVLVVTPILGVLLFITVLGIPFGLIVFLIYFLLLILSYLFVPVLLGSWLWKVIRRADLYEVDWKTILLGALVVIILDLIPVIGWLAQFVLMLVALGAISTFSYRNLASWRQ